MCCKGKFSFFFEVCKKGNDNIVEILLEYRVDVNLCEENGISVFYIVC